MNNHFAAIQESFRKEKAFFLQVAAFTLVFFFAAHAFILFNPIYSGESVMLNAAKGRDAQIAGGQYLQPLYWRLRGSISAPLLVGSLSLLYLILTASVIARILSLRSRCSLCVLCGILTANPSVTAVFADSMHTADAVFLSMLLASCAGAMCLRSGDSRFGFLLSAPFLAVSMALDSSGLSFALSLAFLGLMVRLLDHVPSSGLLVSFIQMSVSFALALLLYAAGYLLMLWRSGITPSASLHAPAGNSLSGAWLYPLKAQLFPFTAYPRVHVFLQTALFALAVVSLFTLLRKRCASRRMIFLLLLFPLCMNLPVFAAQPTGQTSLSFSLFNVLLLMLLTRHPSFTLASGRAIALAFSVLFLGNTVFSNQVYLKKNLEYEATLSVMTRVLDRIEHTDGYTPGYTPVAIIGSLDESVLSVTHQGFEHLTVFDAAAGNYAVVSYEDHIWYFWEIMGYPLNFISSHEQTQLEQTSDVQSMPAFPAKDCCRFIGDILVIRLS